MTILEFWDGGRGELTCRSCRGVATVGLGMTGRLGPGGGVKMSRIIVSCLVVPGPLQVCY